MEILCGQNYENLNFLVPLRESCGHESWFITKSVAYNSRATGKGYLTAVWDHWNWSPYQSVAISVYSEPKSATEGYQEKAESSKQ